MVILEKKLANVKLPDISGDFDVKVVGKVHYELSSLDLRNFHLPHSRISLLPNEGPQVSISNAFADVRGNWKVKKSLMYVPDSLLPCSDSVIFLLSLVSGQMLLCPLQMR
ncbi:hypothetical protein llap_22451 [Limosa lapponica baueri]|uniref:Bactericidal permeability-increasing protein n=1 Tax=Limosa lapponica baueri TaxID=1758121 RepID=A0A2I0T0B1_LIMLA|nr:hypothetical protein llap_22451 [Limosa lapponica baueri]